MMKLFYQNPLETENLATTYAMNTYTPEYEKNSRSNNQFRGLAKNGDFLPELVRFGRHMTN